MQSQRVARTLLEWLLQVRQVPSPQVRAPKQPDMIPAGLHMPLAEQDASKDGGAECRDASAGVVAFELKNVNPLREGAVSLPR